MNIAYESAVIGDGNHASLIIPDEVLEQLGANRRAPLKVTINGHTYQSTATGVAGECRVVFPSADREAAGAKAGDVVRVQLELDSGHREVDIPAELAEALKQAHVTDVFERQNYSTRKEFARSVRDAKATETKQRRIAGIIAKLNHATNPAD